MKTLFFALVLIVIYSHCSTSQTLTPVKNENEKWGLVNKNNDLVVNYIYDKFDNYFEELGFAFVSKDSVNKLLDRKGNEVLTNFDNYNMKYMELPEDNFFAYGILNNGSKVFNIVTGIEVLLEIDELGDNNNIYFFQTENIISQNGLFGICFNGKISNIEFENIKGPCLYFFDNGDSFIHYHSFGVDTTGYIFVDDVIKSLGIQDFYPDDIFYLSNISETQEDIIHKIDLSLDDQKVVNKDLLIPIDNFNTENILFIVKKNNKWGVIDKNFDFILLCEYDNIYIDNEHIVAEKNSIVLYYDHFGNKTK